MRIRRVLRWIPAFDTALLRSAEDDVLMLAVGPVDMARETMRDAVIMVMPVMVMIVIVAVMIMCVVVPMVMTVIMPAAAFIAMLVMMMRFGVDERCRELALERNRHLARRILVLDQ